MIDFSNEKYFMASQSQMEYKANQTEGVHFFGNISKDFLPKDIDFWFELLHFIAALSLR